jgi:uncharacterized protein (DUF433 family)
VQPETTAIDPGARPQTMLTVLTQKPPFIFFGNVVATRKGSFCGRATIGGSSKWDNTVAASRARGETMAEPARIVLDSAVLAGKPVIRGTRLSVDFVIGLMADGWSEADILRNYPGLSHDDIAACLAYARDVLRSEKVYPSAA